MKKTMKQIQIKVLDEFNNVVDTLYYVIKTEDEVFQIISQLKDQDRLSCRTKKYFVEYVIC